MAKKRREELSQQLRQAVDTSGLSRYAVCKAIGLAQATMSRFMHGQGGLSLECVDALADLLDLNITTGKRRSTRKGK
jgi:cyanate lyase